MQAWSAGSILLVTLFTMDCSWKRYSSLPARGAC